MIVTVYKTDTRTTIISRIASILHTIPDFVILKTELSMPIRNSTDMDIEVIDVKEEMNKLLLKHSTDFILFIISNNLNENTTAKQFIKILELWIYKLKKYFEEENLSENTSLVVFQFIEDIFKVLMII